MSLNTGGFSNWKRSYCANFRGNGPRDPSCTSGRCGLVFGCNWVQKGPASPISPVPRTLSRRYSGHGCSSGCGSASAYPVSVWPTYSLRTFLVTSLRPSKRPHWSYRTWCASRAPNGTPKNYFNMRLSMNARSAWSKVIFLDAASSAPVWNAWNPKTRGLRALVVLVSHRVAVYISAYHSASAAYGTRTTSDAII